jgi:hypothetical protein
MRLLCVIIFVFSIFEVSAQSDSTDIKTWRQLSSIPDSNNYNLFFGGPTSVYRSIFFEAYKTNQFAKNLMFLDEQEDIPYLWNNSPVLDAQYIIGDQLEQNLALYHNQAISQNANYAVSFLKRTHDGYLLNQATNSNFFQSLYHYNSVTGKYSLLIGLKHHRIYNQQNGGLTNDSSFFDTDNNFSNRKLLNVNMNHAYSNDKLWKAYVKQEFKLNSTHDSILNITKSKKIVYNLNYTRKYRNYFDSLAADNFLYNHFDSIVSNDSLIKDNISNSVYFEKVEVSDSMSKKLILGLNSDFISHKNRTIDTLFNNQSLFFQYKKHTLKNAFSFSSNYFFMGYRKNNYDMSLQWNQEVSPNLFLNCDLSYNNFRPVYECQNFQSNHQIWTKSYNNIAVQSAEASLKHKKLSYHFNYTSISQPIYFNSFSNPVQYNGNAQVIQSTLRHRLLKKNIRLLTEVIYQYQGGAQIFQLPDLIGQLKLNYLLNIKKANLKIDFGINGKYFSSFDLMDYSPSTNQFFLSNNANQPQYFILDFSAKSQIKNVTVYAMYTHLNAGLLGYNYFAASHYPIPERYLKFGLKWLFLN